MTYCKLYIGNQFSVQLITRTRTRTEFIFLANLISKLCFCHITLNYPPAVTVPVAPLASVVSTLCWWQHPPADWALPPPGWTGYDTTERLLSAPPKTSTGWKKGTETNIIMCLVITQSIQVLETYVTTHNRKSALICPLTLPEVGRAQSIQEVFTKCCPDTSHRLLQQSTNKRSSLGTSNQGDTSLWCGQNAVTWTPAKSHIENSLLSGTSFQSPRRFLGSDSKHYTTLHANYIMTGKI